MPRHPPCFTRYFTPLPFTALFRSLLTLSLDGGNVVVAKLLQYPQSREPDSPPVKRLDDDPAHYYIARSGWIGQGGTRVTELVPEDPQQREIDLTTGQPTVQVSFVSTPGAAVRIRRIYTMLSGSHTLAVHEHVLNESGQGSEGRRGGKEGDRQGNSR